MLRLEKLQKTIIQLKSIFLLIGCFFVQSYGFAQDSTYIKKFTEDYSVRTFISEKFTTLNIENSAKDELTYKPNNPTNIGLGISWKNTAFSFGYGFNFMRDGKKGKTKSLDFQYHYYGRKVVFDLFFQDYRGFYQENENDEDIITHHPDIKVKQYGAFGQYVFNGNKFSYQAAFNQSEKQLKSTGSFLLGGGVYYNELRADTSLVLNENKKIKNTQIGVSGGYGYTWVIKKRYFISTSLTFGINAGVESIDRLGKDKIEVSPTMFPRLAAGYNQDTWSIGLSFVLNRVYAQYSDQSKMSFDTGVLQITFIKRLDTIPILSGIVKHLE